MQKKIIYKLKFPFSWNLSVSTLYSPSMESTLQMYGTKPQACKALLQTVCEVLDHQLCTDVGDIASAHIPIQATEKYKFGKFYT